MILSAPIKNGKADFYPNDAERLRQFLRSHEGKTLYFTVGERKPPRSLEANAYLWAVVYEFIADETGMTPEEVHAEMKDRFLPRFFTRENGEEKELEKSTTRLNSKEMSNYIEQVKAFAASELSVSIPDAE